MLSEASGVVEKMQVEQMTLSLPLLTVGEVMAQFGGVVVNVWE